MVFWREKGLVLDFQFAERQGNVVYDLSGNGNHGTIYGAVWRRGPLLGAVETDGIDDYVDFDSVADDLAAFTSFSFFVLWKPLEVKTQHVAITRNRDHAIGLNSETEFYVAARDAATWVVKTAVVDMGQSVLGKWWYVGFTHDDDAAELRFYVNGELKAVITDVKIITFRPYHNSLGANYNRAVYAAAVFALARLYNRALSEAEIKSHYNYIFGRVQRIRRRMVV